MNTIIQDFYNNPKNDVIWLVLYLVIDVVIITLMFIVFAGC